MIRAKLTVSVVFILMIFNLPGIAQITSNFNTENDGWIVTDQSGGSAHTVTYNPTGGNPGGYLSTSVSLSTSMYWRAPAKFLGGHCQNSYGSNLRFDLQLAGPGSIINGSAIYGHVRISCSYGYTIVMDLSTVPALIPAWTSYTVKLDESTTWRKANNSGPIATHREVVDALSSITVLEIVAQAAFGSDPEVNIDNIVLEQSTLSTPPAISSFTPQNGVAGTDITIMGTNFNITPANTTVYFGGMKTNVITATATQLTVKVPAGASYAPIRVVDEVAGLSASSVIPFQPRYDNNKDFGGQIIRASLAPEIHFTLDGSGTTAAADIDGDGLNDIVIGEGNAGSGTTRQFSVLRNAGITGTITTSSFHPKVSFPLTNAYVKAFIALDDFDSDGKPDVVVSSATVSNAYVTVFRNTSTPGNISFGPEQNLMGVSYSDGPVTTADMDGDGRPEIISIFNNNCGSGDRLYIYPNRSTPGNIDFCGMQTFGSVYTCGGHVTVGDLNGDKLPEVVVEAGNVTVFRNTSTPGDLSMATPFVLATSGGGKTVMTDLDRDGKADLAWPNGNFAIEIRKNNYTSGTFDAASFSSQILITSPVYDGGEVIASDINSDGKLDLVMSSSNDLTIAQNVSTAGTLNTSSFLPGVPYPVNLASSYNTSPVAADFDGDDKPDLLLRTTNTATRLLIYHNECYPAPRIDNLSASSGSPSGSVNLTGDYFSTGTSPVVSGWLGAIEAIIAPSSNTAAAVTIPYAISDRLSLSEHGLTGFSKPFNLLFSTSRVIDASSFSNGVDFPMTNIVREGISVADYDKDGKPDITVADLNTKIFRNTHAVPGDPITTASLTQEPTVYSTGYNAIALDIDGDGLTDLNNGYGVNQNNSTPGNITMLNGTTGAYTYAGGFNAAAAGDFNKDGKTDLALTNGTAFVQLYENRSTRDPFINDASFAPFHVTPVNLARPSNNGGIVAADFNNDGYDDLATVTPFTDNLTVYENLKLYGPLQTVSFSAGTNITTGDDPRNLTARDFDNDGNIDLVVTHYNSTFISVFRNTSTSGAISFAPRADIVTFNKGYNIGSQDLDGDGLAEIVVLFQPNPGPGSFSVFQNTSTPGNITFNDEKNYSLASPARNPYGVGFADINADQKPDILITASPWGGGTFALTVFENRISSGPTITITAQPAFTYACEGSTATFLVEATGTTNITYKWQKYSGSDFADINDGAGYSGTATNVLSINTSVTSFSGNGEYRARINGDLATEVFSDDPQLTINSLPLPPDVTGDSDCTTPATLTLTATGGSDGDYNWYDSSSGTVVLETDGTFVTPSISSTTTYYVSLKDTFCESDRVPVTATIAPLTKPVINSSQPLVGGNVNLCDGESTTLSAPNGFASYSWSTGATTQQITVSTSQVVTITVTDTSPCTSPASDPLTVEVHDYPLAEITVNGTQLLASTGDSYQWFQNNEAITGATSQAYEFNILEYGIFSVDVTDNGCTSSSGTFTYLITPIESGSSDWKIYPNPFKANLHVESAASKQAEITITDPSGRNVYQRHLKGNTEFSLDELPQGQYMLFIHSGKQDLYFRIIKTQ